MRIRLVFALLVLTVFATTASAQSQITTGVIQGTVTDPTGATVPGVTVEARNLETNLSRTIVTEGDGRFVFLQLPPGNYKLTFTLSGFATLVQENLPLTVEQAITIPAVAESFIPHPSAGARDGPPARARRRRRS